MNVKFYFKLINLLLNLNSNKILLMKVDQILREISIYSQSHTTLI